MATIRGHLTICAKLMGWTAPGSGIAMCQGGRRGAPLPPEPASTQTTAIGLDLAENVVGPPASPRVNRLEGLVIYPHGH
jgi:hypothetical protein